MLTKKEMELIYNNKDVLVSLLQVAEVRTVFKLFMVQIDFPQKEQILFEIDSGYYENFGYLLDKMLAAYMKVNPEIKTDTSLNSVTNEIWSEALESLSGVISEPSFNAWLRDTYLIKETEDTLFVSATNSFSRDWLEERYTDKVKNVLSNTRCKEHDVKFVVPDPLNPKK